MRKLLAMAAAVLLAACTRTVEPMPDGTIGIGNTTTVHSITLSDGTRCAVLVGTYRGGISCNWRTAP